MTLFDQKQKKKSVLKKILSLEYFWAIVLLSVATICFNWQTVIKSKIIFPAEVVLENQSFFTAQSATNPANNKSDVDLAYRVYPSVHYSWDNLRQFKIPLWNPSLLAGTPHLADSQSGVFELSKLSFYWLPLGFSLFWNLLILSRFFLAGFFMYIFGRSLRLSKAASLFCSLAFMFSAFMVGWAGHARAAVALWLPCLLWATEKYVQTQKHRFLVFLSLATCFFFYAGLVDTSGHVLLLFIFYGLGRTISEAISKRSFKVFKFLSSRLFFAFLLGALLAAPQFLPTFEYITHSDLFASSKASTASQASTSAKQLVSSSKKYITDFFLLFSPTAASEQVNGTWVLKHTNYQDAGLYAGLTTIVLALVALIGRWRRKLVLFLFVTFCGSLGLALLTPSLARLDLLKLTHLLLTPRLRLLTQFSLVLLAGFGFDYLRVQFPKQKSLVFTLVGILFAELFWAHASFLPLADKANVYPSNSTIEFLQKRTSRSERILGINNVMHPNAASLFGLYDIRGSQALMNKSYAQLFKQLGRQNGQYLLSSEANTKLLQLTGTKYVLVESAKDKPHLEGNFTVLQDDPVTLLSYTDALPRAHLVFDINRFGTNEAAISEVASSRFDPSKEAIVETRLEGSDLKYLEDPEQTSYQAGSTELVAYTANQVEIETSSSEDGFLVLSDSYYPGWIAKIDGADTNIYQANGAFRGLHVRRGNHTIIFSYKPMSFFIGLCLSGIALVLLIFSSIPRVHYHLGQIILNLKAKLYEHRHAREYD